MNRLYNWIYERLGDGSDTIGKHPPGTDQKFRWGEDDGSDFMVTTYNNDGFELWFSWCNKWVMFMKAKEARRLAWFILWTWWGKGTWFGLKRFIWYWALGKRCEKYRIYTEVKE